MEVASALSMAKVYQSSSNEMAAVLGIAFVAAECDEVVNCFVVANRVCRHGVILSIFLFVAVLLSDARLHRHRIAYISNPVIRRIRCHRVLKVL